MRALAIVLGLALPSIALGQQAPVPPSTLGSTVVQTGPVLIDFEDMKTRGWGEGGQVVITDQYAARGVTFNSPKVFDYSQSTPIPGLVHGTHGIQQCYAIEFCKEPIVATFTTAQARVTVWVGYATRHEAGTISFTARDAAGTVLDQKTISLPASDSAAPVQSMEIVDANRRIVSVEVQSAGGFDIRDTVVDDLEFDNQVPAPPQPVPEPAAPLDIALGQPTFTANPGEEAVITVPVKVSGTNAAATTLLAESEGWEGAVTTEVPPLEPGEHSVSVTLPVTLLGGRYAVQLVINPPPGQQESTTANNTAALTVDIPGTIPDRGPPRRDFGPLPILIALAVLILAGVLVIRIMKRPPQVAQALPHIVFDPHVDMGSQAFRDGGNAWGDFDVSLRPQRGTEDSSVKEQA